MDLVRVIINHVNVAGVFESPSVRAKGGTVSVRADSGAANQVRITKRQEGVSSEIPEQISIVDRNSIRNAPGRSLLASVANQTEPGGNTFRAETLGEYPLEEHPSKEEQVSLAINDMSAPVFRPYSPSSVSSDEFYSCDELSDGSDKFYSCDEFSDDSDEIAHRPAIPQRQNSSRGQQAAIPARAREFGHIYHEIAFYIHKNLGKAYGQGIHSGIRKIGINPGVQPMVGASRAGSYPGDSNNTASAGVDNVRSPGKSRPGISDRLIKAVGLTPERMLAKPEALNTLTENLTATIVGELKKAESWPDHVTDGVDGVDGDVVDLEGEDDWVSGFTRSISTILVHLTHQAFLDTVTRADTDAGKKNISAMLTRLVVSILDLSEHQSAQTNAEGVGSTLNNGIVTLSQSGNKLFNEKMKAVRADSLRKMINQALVSMMAEGIELTENNVDEFLSRLKQIIINTLMNTRTDTVRICSEWHRRQPDEIDRIQNRIANSAAKALTTIVQKHSNFAVRKFSAAMDGISKVFGKISSLWKSNKPEEEPVEYTEKKIRQLINKKIEEVVQVFQNEQEFNDKLKPLIAEKLEKIAPDIKETLRKLKGETKACKDNREDVQDLVNRITATFAGNGQHPVSPETLQGAIAASSALEYPITSEALASGDQSDRASTSYSSEVTTSDVKTEPHARQNPVIDQLIAQESSRMVDKALGLLIGELRKNLDTVIASVEPGIEKVVETALNKGATFIAERNEDGHIADQGLPETIPGFRAAMTPVLTKLAVDILSRKLESEAWETVVHSKGREVFGKSNTPSDPAKIFDKVLKTAEVVALQQVTEPLKSVIDNLPLDSVQKLASDVILQGVQDGTVWLDDQVRDLFNRKTGDASIVQAVINTISEEAARLQHQLMCAAINWMKQRATEWVTKSRVDHCMDWLAAWIEENKEQIDLDVRAYVKTLLVQATPELEGAIHERLASLLSAVEGSKVDVATAFQQIVEDLEPEEKPGFFTGKFTGKHTGKGDQKTTADQQNQQDHWRDARMAVADQLDNLAGETVGLIIDQSEQLAAARPILSGSIREIMDVAVKEAALFTARRNGQVCDDVSAIEGGTVLAGQLPAFLTTVIVEMLVELLSNRLQFVDWKKGTVAGITAGEATADSSTIIAREVDRMLGEWLAGMVTAVADQVEALLQKHSYPSADALLEDLTRQGIHDSATWMDALVHGLFAGDAGVVSRVVDALTEQAESLVQTLVTRGLEWLATVDQATGQQNRQTIQEIMVRRGNALVEPLLAGAMGEVAELGQQASASTALRNAVVPFVQDQVQKGQVLERLAAYGVDTLVNSVSRHKEHLAGDVKSLTRASINNVVPELEKLLHTRLQALAAEMKKGPEKKCDVVADLRRAAKGQMPGEKPGDAAVGVVVKSVKKTTPDHQQQQDHWHDARMAAAGQVSEIVGDFINLTVGETEQLEVVRSILSDSFDEVMKVAVRESAEFVARHNGIQYDSRQGNGVLLPGKSVSKLTSVVSPNLTTSVVEHISRKLLSAAWQKQTVGEVKKAAEKALAPGNRGTVNLPTSSDEQQTVQRVAADQHTAIAAEADEMLKKGLAGMLHTGANQLEVLLKGLPHDSLKAMASDLTLQGIADSTRWLDELATGLFSDNDVVIPRVIDAITEQAVVTQQAVIDGVLGWLTKEDITTKQQPNRQKLVDILVHRLNALVEPVVTGASGLVAQRLKLKPDSRALRDAVLPFLQNQLNKGKVLESLAGYGVDQLSGWIGQHGRVIKKEVEVNVRAMMQKAAPELESILHDRLAALRATVKQSPQNKHDVVATLRKAAEVIAPHQVMDTASGKGSNSQQSQVMEDLIPDLSKGIAEVITTGADIIRRKAWADNLRLQIGKDDDYSRMSIFPIVIPYVQQMVKKAVSAGAEYSTGTLAEPSDGSAVGITEAVSTHLQRLTADCLGQIVADAIEGMANAVHNNAEGIQSAIEQGLTNGGASEGDLASLLTPHIHGVIDHALNQGKGVIREGMEKWIRANASAATPELHNAIDKLLTYLMANGGEWIIRHQPGIEIEVIEPIQKEITETLKQVQADIIQSIALWLSNDANLQHFVSVFTSQTRTAVTRAVVDTVATMISGKDVSGKKEETECKRAVEAMTPYITPIIDQALTQAMTYTGRWLSGWVRDHGADISSMVNPLIDKTVQDVMPSVRQAVQDKALLLAQNKAQDINFNRLAAELAVSFVNRFDPDKLTTGVLKVEPKSSVARELPKILCFLMQTAETYECLGGNLNEPVRIDRVVIDGRVFKNIEAYLVRMKDGSIQIRKMDLVFVNADNIDVDIEMAGVSISYQLPEKSKLYKAALLAAAPMMKPADLAERIFDTFIPDHIDFNVDQISAEFRDAILDGPGDDVIGVGLSNLKFSLRLHKYYPKPYMEINAGPQDGHKTIESVKVNVTGEGLVDYVEADIHIDRHRNGFADVTARLEPARVNGFADWLLGGAIKIEAKLAVNNAIATLDDIDSIHVRAARFQGLCSVLLKNTIRANNPGFTLGNDGRAVIKLKLAPFSEERSNRFTRWLAKTANRIIQFFTRPIVIPMSFKGAPYTPAAKDEKGIGSFNALRFIDGLFPPCPFSIHSDTHEELLRKLRMVSIDENPQYYLQQLGNIVDQVIEEFRMGSAPSDLTLVREIPLESLVLLVDQVKNEGGQDDLARLLFLVANLVEALPEKAVQLVSQSGFTPESGGQPYLLHLISTTPTTSWLANPKDGKVIEPIYQSHRFNRLQEFWQNSQTNSDGTIYSPGSAKGPARKFTEKVVGKVQTLARDINMPDDIRLLMARDFDFAHKAFGIGGSVRQDLLVNSPANPQLPYHSQGVLPVSRIKDVDRLKRRHNLPEGQELSEGSPALAG